MSVRSVAVRQAAKIRSERAAAFAIREAAIEELALGYLEATGTANEVIEAAQRRCAQILATAQANAAQAKARAATSVAGLETMGVARSEIAQITGLSARQVRELLTPKTVTDPSAESHVVNTPATPAPGEDAHRSEPDGPQDTGDEHGPVSSTTGTSADAALPTVPEGSSFPTAAGPASGTASSTELNGAAAGRDVGAGGDERVGVLSEPAPGEPGVRGRLGALTPLRQ